MQFANIPAIGHFPLKMIGKIICLKTHLKGEYIRYFVGTIAKIIKIEDKLNTIACGELNPIISKNILLI